MENEKIIICNCNKCLKEYKKEQYKLLKKYLKSIWKDTTYYNELFDIKYYNNAILTAKEVIRLIKDLEKRGIK